MFARTITLLSLITLPTVLFAQQVGIAEQGTLGKSTEASASTTAAETAGTASETPEKMSFEGKLITANGLYKNNDFAGALRLYNEAKDEKPDSAIAYYFIACAEVKLGNYDNALAALTTATTLAADKELTVHGKSLFYIAVIRETKREYDAAVSAWQAYKAFAEVHPKEAIYVASADSRIAAYEKKKQLDGAYVAVRERIAANVAKAAKKKK